MFLKRKEVETLLKLCDQMGVLENQMGRLENQVENLGGDILRLENEGQLIEAGWKRLPTGPLVAGGFPYFPGWVPPKHCKNLQKWYCYSDAVKLLRLLGEK